MAAIIAIGIILLDQLTKLMILNKMEVHQSVPVIENIFHITYIQNRGMAFGKMQDQRLFFIIVTVLVVGGIILYSIKNKDEVVGVFKMSLTFICAGAIGNFIDRVRLSYVVDFFDFRIWPVFNIADIFIVAGTALLCIYMFFIEPKISKKKEEQVGNI